RFPQAGGVRTLPERGPEERDGSTVVRVAQVPKAKTLRVGGVRWRPRRVTPEGLLRFRVASPAHQGGSQVEVRIRESGSQVDRAPERRLRFGDSAGAVRAAQRAFAQLPVADAAVGIPLDGPPPEGLRVSPDRGIAPGCDSEGHDPDAGDDGDNPRGHAGEHATPHEAYHREGRPAGEHREAETGNVAVAVGGQIRAPSGGRADTGG